MTDAAEDFNQVAIIGMAGRFPGAPDVDAFWHNLRDGRETVAALSDEELLAAGVRPDLLQQGNYVKAKGVLEDGDRFDAGFFGFSPREAEIMDPQHRVFLECAWEALESAGCDPRTFEGRIGVFAGASLNTYMLFNVMRNRRVVESAGDYQTLLASDKDFLATRVSYKLDLKGPSLTVQTACSTSLTAVHLACQSLFNGECDIALAGGVSVSVPLQNGYLYEQGGILSPDGHCRAFDAAGGGTVSGNGAGVVVLRRLSEARENGDTVDAVIRGTAVNNDGALKAGYTAPSVDGQAEVMAEALAVADVDASSIGYVEAHGTGTALGDPIEIAALTRAYREHTQETGFCAIGSVKSNIGHLDAAAGVTALIKATLALKYEAIPATVNFTEANPQLKLETSPFFVNTELRPWPRQPVPRRAGVSSFGIGGTNVHVILEEAPAVTPAPPAGRPAAAMHLLPLSGRTPEALAAGAARLADHLESHPDLDLGDVAHHLATRRRAFESRQAVVGRDTGEAVAALRRLVAADAVTAAGQQAPVAFLFPGQGAQHANMARDLYRHEPRFAAEIDRCAELFRGHLGEDLRTTLFPADGEEEAAARKLEQTAITQPVLFMVEYALARLWSSWGVQPRAMVGHSIGEYVAACLAGVFSLEDAVRLVAARGRLVQSMPRGAMLSVFLPEAETERLLGDGLCLAAANSTALSVVSGPAEAVDALQQKMAADGVACRRLHTSHAFHSPSMDAAVEPFVDEVRKVVLSTPKIPFCSNVTGTWITDEQATSPEYWGSHLRRMVRFSDALDEILGDPALLPLEVGPGESLRNFVRQHRAWQDGRTLLGSLRHPNEKRDDREYLLTALGGLWSAGGPVEWTAVHEGTDHRLVRLPGYAFQRQRFWVDADAAAEERQQGPAAADSADDWFYSPGWRRMAPLGGAPGSAADAVWVVLGAELALGRELAARLEGDGATVVRVGAGEDLHHDGDRAWTIDIAQRDHYAGVLTAAQSVGTDNLRVVHLWSLESGTDHGTDGTVTAARLDSARRVGFDSLLALAQGIGDARPTAPVAVDVLCRGIHSVTGEEPLHPENATLLGACTVIPQEISDATCRALDITGTDPAAPRDGAVRAVLGMLGRTTEDRDLALRGQHWWVRDFDRVPLEAGDEGRARLRDNGAYLITGGLGGLGLAHAEHIARNADNPVLGLLTRSGFPAESGWQDWLDAHEDQEPTAVRIRRIRQLQGLGARVVVLQGDVTDAQETAAAVARLREHGALRGVVHAAGLPSSGLMAAKSTQDADQVLAAKTRGTLVLDQVCADDELDFVLLCSSLTSVLGGPGQSDYCAANAFLDAYAQFKRRETGAPVTSVAWDTWSGVGMAAGMLTRFGDEPAGEPTGHPLLRLLRADAESRSYVSTLTTADSWIVDDHRIMGHGLVPGTTYLELVRAAVAQDAGDRDIELHDVLFMMPVIVPDGQQRDIHTTIDLRDDRTRFTVRSRTGDGNWQDHTSGSITYHDRQARQPYDLDELLRSCEVTEDIDTDEALKRRLRLDRFERGSQMEFSFGPRWHCLRRIQSGERRLLATLELEEEFRSDTEDYALHPALLDVAGGTARIHAKDAYYLPFTYRSMRVVAGLTSTIHCYVELKGSDDSTGETMTCDIDILDPQGNLLVRISEFTIKRINDITGLRDQIETASLPPAEDTGEEEAFSTLRALSEGISEQEGVAAFARILAAPAVPDQLVVSSKDLAAMRRLARSITPELLAREVENLAPLAGTHPRPDLATPYVEPATEEEKAVAAIWQEVLGLEQVGVNDDFFALGGHSLAAVQIGAKIQTNFGRELDLRDFFNDPTVANTVGLLAGSGGRAAGPQDTIEVLRRDEADDELEELSDDEVEAQLQALLAAEAEEAGEEPV